MFDGQIEHLGARDFVLTDSLLFEPFLPDTAQRHQFGDVGAWGSKRRDSWSGLTRAMLDARPTGCLQLSQTVILPFGRTGFEPGPPITG